MSLATLALAGSLAGCGAETAAGSPPTATPLPPTSTVQVAFQIGQYQAPPTVPPRTRPTPRPTPFVRPHRPFIYLSPSVGLPVSRRITVVGGNLPQSTAVDLLWSPHGYVSPLSTTGYTDRHGNLFQSLLVPASPPGSYRVLLEAGGVPYATALYRVISRASLDVRVLLGSSGQSLAVSGTRFLPRLRLMLVAYAMFTGQKPVRVALVETDAHGRFSLTRPLPNLPAGQYVMSAWAMSALSAQVADAVFEVNF